jgi:hypothetical protein
MAGEDTEGWKKLSVYCCDLWSVEITDSAVISCSTERCV